MLELLLMCVAGVAAGAFTGLIPGVHPNMMAVIVLSVSPALLGTFSAEAVAVLIVTMAISHTFLSFLPSVFVGAPEGDTALSVLPGHRMLLEGRGFEAIYLTVLGGLGVMGLSAVTFPLVCWALPLVYAHISGYIAFLLIFTASLMIFTERSWKKVKGLAVFGLSGVLGMIVLGMPVLPSKDILFPVFTGLFGISTMLMSLSSGVKVPEQNMAVAGLGKTRGISAVLKGWLSGLVVGVLPGVGASQAAVMVHQFGRDRDSRGFLVSLGGINTVATLFSLMALYLISRPRSGVAVVVSQLLPEMGLGELGLFVAAALFAAGLSGALALWLTGWFARGIQTLDYQKLSLGIIGFLVVLVGLMTGVLGLFVLGVSTATGMLAPLWGVKRTHSMGVLMLPVILFYLGVM